MTNPDTEFIPFALPSLGAEEEEAVTAGPPLRLADHREAKQRPLKRSSRPKSAQLTHWPSIPPLRGCTCPWRPWGSAPGDTVCNKPLHLYRHSRGCSVTWGAELLFSDISPGGFNMDPSLLRETLQAAQKNGRRLKALIPVHVAGEPCPY